MDDFTCSALVLAAGKGTRMKSDLVKVLHPVLFVPMIHHVLAALAGLGLAKTAVVVGHQQDKVRQALAGHDVDFVEQAEQLGTGHAVLCARSALEAAGGTVLILCGDIPLLRPATLQAMLARHRRERPAITLMTTTLADPTNYGRVVCGEDGLARRIVEEKDASPEERAITIINAGIYCVEARFLFRALAGVGSDNSQGEIYLTDIVAKAVEAGERIGTFACADAMEVLGVNSRVELAAAHGVLQRRKNEELMVSGVTLLAPDTVHVAGSARIGRDTTLGPNVMITGETVLGGGCSIGPNVVLESVWVGEGAEIGAFSYLEGCLVQAFEKIPAYSRRTREA